jgi:hypothetical protein
MIKVGKDIEGEKLAGIWDEEKDYSLVWILSNG